MSNDLFDDLFDDDDYPSDPRPRPRPKRKLPPIPKSPIRRSHRLKNGVVLSGRPDRETVIGEEDIINMKIAYGTAKSLDEFLNSV